jgi:hypothetical protein
MRKALILLIRAYSYALSPLLGANCRFHPTCSCYAMEAVERHGAAKELCLAIGRLLKCHPWHGGAAHDPVPGEVDWPRLIGYKRERIQKD